MKKKPIRICLITEYFYPANNAPAARFKPLADTLSKYSEVRIYTSKISTAVRSQRLTYNIVPFPDNTRGVYYRLFFELLFSLETFLRLLASRADLYYITSPSFFNCLAAAAYCRIFRKKYVVDIRDDYPRVFFDTGLIKEKSLLGRALHSVEKSLYRNSAFVIAATEGLASNIKRIYSGDVYLLRNGFSEAMFAHSSQKYPLFTLVLHGNLSSFQGIDTIIELAESLETYKDRIQILVIGKGSDDYKLKNTSSGVIKYIGPKPHHEIASLISKAHIGLSLRKGGKISEDAFPVRAYEYIGVCLPILVTPVSEAGHYIEKLSMGYQFETHQIKEMKQRILDLMEDQNLYDSTVEKIKASRIQFSREKLSEDFVAYLMKKLSA